ncbi:DUF6236 family protein [Paraburkholderia unamae]|uniref:Uncharacterized protein n=1 Tax=Paraburkholderia unamae TaxID=219649 RepID=A0ABX5KQY7_9BURK|nr:DUF6236 family protein [Paraburkholderia unamae]PVX82418.1 hypothetical protein C7402_109272 [Paraburkholderia unamae]
MRNNALYFPFISVPNTAWTIRTLLYWDKLSSIVPLEYNYRRRELAPFMRELLSADLVTAVSPAAHLYRLGDFESAFIQLLEDRLKRQRLSQVPLVRTRVDIHIEKLAGIAEFLVERGLAARNGASWYSVDTPVANLFMTYLAVCLGNLDDVDAEPVTNLWEYAQWFGHGTASRRGKAPQHQQARHQILTCLLPIPDERVTLSELVDFKEKHGSLLPALRIKIESQSAVIANLPDPEDRADATLAFINDCQLQVDELRDAMRFSWKRLVFGALAPLSGTGMQWASTPPDTVMAFSGGAVSFAGAVYAAFSSIGGLSDVQKKQPLAYIAHARGRLSRNDRSK